LTLTYLDTVYNIYNLIRDFNTDISQKTMYRPIIIGKYIVFMISLTIMERNMTISKDLVNSNTYFPIKIYKNTHSLGLLSSNGITENRLDYVNDQ